MDFITEAAGGRAPTMRGHCIERAPNMFSNTALTGIDHHPAISVPRGMPVSMVLIGKHFDEPAIYRAAYAFEQSGDWTKM